MTDAYTNRPHDLHGEVTEIPTRQGATRLAYAPNLDGQADPGEIVWTWVPYEEDPNKGKDRPVLVVGHKRNRVQGLMLSSKEPDHWEEHDWFELGDGPWDRSGRDSYLCLDRLFEFDEEDIRREGAVLDGDRFVRVAVELQNRYGWEAGSA
ncbi:type II toxin-antitoxin system PemK/MazF family toxin [Actinoalloteichus hymeniacidonis]|uniref:PemK-like protein n=1 Tax=Actinoalloteichus hymeniacidonis TaxID=340345 RepID=A0AAC9HNC8_9PSEU|nr:type II toxin-antitoxin system PemK/MazF family toxin [Actinoalloteichus hymeniacidonis]AOS62509.1 PemK-like protein [Actinoalloteichus hymeniacidonis]MBB5909460.1 hypothetical protein [Actinoalloteichus hymeniacidonis]